MKTALPARNDGGHGLRQCGRQIQQSAGGRSPRPSVFHPSLAGSCRLIIHRAFLSAIHPSDCSFLSAAGYRTTSGALSSVGANGNYWSSSSYAAGNLNAGNLNFNSTVVNPLNGNNRANGFSVRCVQHLLRAVFA